VLSASPIRAEAQTTTNKEQAKRLFDEGLELEKKGEYTQALAKYKDAEQLVVTAGLRFHQGYCLEMTGKIAAAFETYEAADKLARDQNKPEVHAAIVARLDPLRPKVPQISIRLATAVKDAEVQLDGAPLAATVLDGTVFRIEPGEHRVTARAAGYKPFVRKVQAPESITTTVDVVLEHVASLSGSDAAADRPVTEPLPEAARRRSLALPIATTAGAVVLAGTGIAMFLVAGSKQSAAKRDCPTKTSCDSEQKKVRTFDALALGGFIGAAGLGALSVVLWMSTKAGGSRTGSSTRLVASPTDLMLEGTFW
jgi:hypothetical protein